MNKKYLIASIVTGALLSAGFAGAVATVENSTSASANAGVAPGTITGDVQTDANVQVNDGSAQKIDTPVNRLDSRIDTIVNRLDAKIDAAAESSARVLPTVNKADGQTEGDSQRVLPTVNKKTTAKVQVRGWDAEKKEAILAKIEAALENNPNIKSVVVAEESVTVNYSAPGKFLGLFPMYFNLNVVADANARVKVRFPWYRFLLKTEFSESAELLNGVFQHNQTDLEFLTSRASEDRQAEIFITISNSLQVMREMSKPIIANIRA